VTEAISLLPQINNLEADKKILETKVAELRGKVEVSMEKKKLRALIW